MTKERPEWRERLFARRPDDDAEVLAAAWRLILGPDSKYVVHVR